MTTFSPCTTGSVATRRSTLRPPTFTDNRPSWGLRRSAMSMLAMILSRDTSPDLTRLSVVIASLSTPSTR